MIARLFARRFPESTRLLSWLFGPPPPPREPSPQRPRLRLRDVPGALLERALCWIARRAVATARGCQSWRLAYRRERVVLAFSWNGLAFLFQYNITGRR